MTPLEKQIEAIIGTVHNRQPQGTHKLKYHERFTRSAEEKAITILECLARRGIDFQEFAYLSIGGSTGVELNYIMTHTAIRYGCLLEQDFQAVKVAEETSAAIRQNGRTIQIFCGDAMQEIQGCRATLMSWRSAGYVKGLICSAQAVLHELPTRSPAFDLNHLLGEALWDWSPCVFIAREPCRPTNWPDTVQLALKDVGSIHLEKLANDIKAKLNISSSVRRSGPHFVTLSATLAVELLFKLFYLQDYNYEIQERVTSFEANGLVHAVESQLGLNSVSQMRHNSNSFESFYRKSGAIAKNTEGNSLAMPVVFLLLIGSRGLNADSIIDRDGKVNEATDSPTGTKTDSFVGLNRQREMALNTPIIPWRPQGSPSLRFLWPRLVIDSLVRSHKLPEGKLGRIGDLLKDFQWNKNLAFVGPPGSGKSTVLRSQFLSLAHKDVSKESPYPVFGHASEFLQVLRDQNKSSSLKATLLEAERSGSSIVHFIDGLDEIDSLLSNDLLSWIDKESSNTRSFCVACRTQFFFQELSHPQTSFLFYDILELVPWDLNSDSRMFVSQFAELIQRPSLLTAFDALSNNASTVSFLTNPFSLTLVVYLLLTEADTTRTFLSRYTVYRDFYKHWLTRESHRKTSPSDARTIKAKHTRIALRLFQSRGHVEPRALRITGRARRDTGLIGLLNITEQGEVNGFLHETLGEYILGAAILDCLSGSLSRLRRTLLVTYTFGINGFVRDGLSLLDEAQCNTLITHLSKLYCSLVLAADKDEIAKTDMFNEQHLSVSPADGVASSENLRLREQLLYYIGRIRCSHCPPSLMLAFAIERHPLLKRIAALGAILHGNEEIENQYLAKLTAGSICDVDNRSVQLVYFGDVKGDIWSFRDDGRTVWSNTRATLFSRIGGTEERDLRLRRWDLRTLLLFLLSRNAFIVTQREFDYVASADLIEVGSIERVTAIRNEKAALLAMLKIDSS